MIANILFCNKDEFKKNNYKVLNSFLSTKNKKLFIQAYAKKNSCYILLDKSLFFLCLLNRKTPKTESTEAFCNSDFSEAKNKIGECFLFFFKFSIKKFFIYADQLNKQQALGLSVGAFVSSYAYKKIDFDNLLSLNIQKDWFNTGPNFVIKGVPLKILQEGKTQAQAINIARHLVNLPPNVLNTKTYAQWIAQIWKTFLNTEVSLWDETKLKKEKMELLLAVGKASDNKSYLVKIKYRGLKNTQKIDTAFVGKGVVFDSGGLGIKPSGSMRLMKKDMGGSASVLGLAYWVATNQPAINCDFYLAIAENSIAAEAFRPGDVYKSRSGKLVEIHHTDAEGRLILADALSVAVETKPKKIINVATLTGATRVGLGYDVGGLYSNNKSLSDEIFKSSQLSGEALWPMPLVKKYKKQLNSNTADIAHASDGMGGGIRAALFLEEFVESVPWAHLDIYAWQNVPEGALLETGGSGQAVQSLIYWMQNYLICK